MNDLAESAVAAPGPALRADLIALCEQAKTARERRDVLRTLTQEPDPADAVLSAFRYCSKRLYSLGTLCDDLVRACLRGRMPVTVRDLVATCSGPNAGAVFVLRLVRKLPDSQPFTEDLAMLLSEHLPLTGILGAQDRTVLHRGRPMSQAVAHLLLGTSSVDLTIAVAAAAATGHVTLTPEDVDTMARVRDDLVGQLLLTSPTLRRHLSPEQVNGQLSHLNGTVAAEVARRLLTASDVTRWPETTQVLLLNTASWTQFDRWVTGELPLAPDPDILTEVAEHPGGAFPKTAEPRFGADRPVDNILFVCGSDMPAAALARPAVQHLFDRAPLALTALAYPGADDSVEHVDLAGATHFRDHLTSRAAEWARTHQRPVAAPGRLTEVADACRPRTVAELFTIADALHT